MKRSHLSFGLLIALSSSALISTPAAASIWWAATPSGVAYTAGTSLMFDVDPTQSNATNEALAFQGIEVTATSTIDGTQFYNTGGAGSNFIFNNANAIAPGEMVTFDFQFNMVLGSGPRNFGALGSAIRSAARFRVADAVDGTLMATITGGNFGNLFISPAPAVGATSYSNTTTDIEFTGSEFASVSGNTASFTEDSSASAFLVDIVDRTRDINAADFSFDRITYKFTNDGATDIAAGTEFRFTFEGTNREAQLAAIVIPEPSRVLFLGIGVVGLLARRRR